MFYDINKLFTIGQFAKLHEINKKTLMWYDETGILKPAVIKENGYRYYSFQQSSILETILMLRELDVSISEIQDFLKNRSASSLETLLANKIKELDATISHLKSIRAIMDEKRRNMSTIRNLNLSEISIVDKPEAHYFVTVPTSYDTPLEKEVEMVVAEAKKYQLKRLHDASYGSILPVESLYCGNFNDYSALYIELPFPTRRKGLHVQPKGKYLRAFCKGAWDNLPERYMKILSYAKEYKLQFYGFAYERGINELVIDAMDDYITQIEIPVKIE
ncbi:MAG: MerR family transcriptional regulator [Lacrimispora saccharolytica]